MPRQQSGHAILVEHRDAFHALAPDPKDSTEKPSYRPKTGSVNQTQLSDLAKISRERLGQILHGAVPAHEHELRNILKWLEERIDIGALVEDLLYLQQHAAGEAPSFFAANDGLFAKNEWSIGRLLEPARLRMQVVERPVQAWVDSAALATARDECSEESGDIVYLVGVRVDSRESRQTESCYVDLAPATFDEWYAVRRLRLHDPKALARADDSLPERLDEFLASAVPTALCINVVVLLKDLEVLCVQRSHGVTGAAGKWMVGIVETMKSTDWDFYSLAYRALKEELLIQPGEIGPIHFTWLGIYRPTLRGHVVAVARVPLRLGELRARRGQAFGGWEASDLAKTSLDQEVLDGFVASRTRLHAHDEHPSFEYDGREWVDHSRLALHEALRFRPVL